MELRQELSPPWASGQSPWEDHVVDEGVLASWVTGESVYGENRRLRVGLEEQAQAYVLVIAGKEDV